MENLNKCLCIRNEITKIDEKILEIKTVAFSPKIPRITGVPSGGGGSDTATERYIIRLEKLEARRKVLSEKLTLLWNKAHESMKKNGVQQDVLLLMFYRFYIGHSWGISTKKVQSKYPNKNWNKNKSFREYAKIQKILYKSY